LGYWVLARPQRLVKPAGAMTGARLQPLQPHLLAEDLLHESRAWYGRTRGVREDTNRLQMKLFDTGTMTMSDRQWSL
jgi:hypothetical protein